MKGIGMGILILGFWAFTQPAWANGCTDICQGNAGCTRNCLQVVTNMVSNIDGQVCKTYHSSGQQQGAQICRQTLELVIGRMIK